VILTPVLLRELERNKVHNPNARLRERARASILWIADRLNDEDPISLRNGVTLVFNEQEPLIDYAEHRLSRDIADDHLIASAIDWQKRSGHQVVIATDDTALALILRSRSIGRLSPPDEWRLPDAVDAERAEVHELKRELERERNRRPQLVVQFAGGGNKSSISPEQIEFPRPISSIRESHAPMTFDEYMRSDKRTAPGAYTYSRDPIDNYNKEIEEFFNDYENYILRYENWIETEARTIEIALVLGNIGSSPASNIDIRLSFPSHIEIMAADDGPEAPDEPEPPSKPRPGRHLERMTQVFPLVQSYAEPNIKYDGQAEISHNSVYAEYFVRELKHDCAFNLDSVLARFADIASMKPFTIQVEITCNETKRVVDKLVVCPQPKPPLSS
jgi:hypothetical protein